MSKSGNWIEKTNAINRLITYSKMKRVIADENLSRIKLPKKFIVIKELESGRLLSAAKTKELIDRHLKFETYSLSPARIWLTMNSLDAKYGLFIYAERITSIDGKFGDETCNELIKLGKSAPFDVGFNNIFRDVNDYATIIDTEYKGPDFVKRKIKGRYCK